MLIFRQGTEDFDTIKRSMLSYAGYELNNKISYFNYTRFAPSVHLNIKKLTFCEQISQ